MHETSLKLQTEFYGSVARVHPFGPSEKHSVIKGGFCISVFAVASKDESVLVVKPKEHPRWKEEWAPNWRLYDPEMLSGGYRSWRFPSSYIREGEAPTKRFPGS